MSTPTATPPSTENASAEAETRHSGWASDSYSDDFDYTPVSPWGPVALALGVAGLTAFLSVFGIGLSVIGVLVGIAAVVRIRGEQGAVKGQGFAVMGLVLSVCCCGLGTAKMVHLYNTEVPEGYRRVNFPVEISDKEFVYYGGARRLHPDVAPLIGTQVYLKGFMWETKSLTGLTEFVFLKDNGECCFGGSPQPYDMMVVYLDPDNPTDAYTGMVAVAGTLRANVSAGEGEPVYTVEAKIVKEAPTPF